MKLGPIEIVITRSAGDERNRASRYEGKRNRARIRVNRRGGLSIRTKDLLESRDFRRLLDQMEKLPLGQVLDRG